MPEFYTTLLRTDARTKPTGVETQLQVLVTLSICSITNLCGNSIKFTEQGYVEIVADVIERKSDQVKVKVIIRDTGIGLEKNVQEQIFNSFSQADSSTTNKFLVELSSYFLYSRKFDDFRNNVEVPLRVIFALN